jgi:hypothetical protein
MDGGQFPTGYIDVNQFSLRVRALTSRRAECGSHQRDGGAFDVHFDFPRRFHVRLGLWRRAARELQLPLHAGVCSREESR